MTPILGDLVGVILKELSEEVGGEKNKDKDLVRDKRPDLLSSASRLGSRLFKSS